MSEDIEKTEAEELESAEISKVDESNTYDENQIQVLEGLEAVRKRPGMYIGSTGPRGLHHLVYEIVDNSIDEALAGFCSEINVEIEPNDIIKVSDNGRGIPTGIHPKEGISAATVVFTVLHAGGKFGGGGYKVAGGLHGVGASVVNALSEWLEVTIYDGSRVHFQRFERGAAVEPIKETGSTDKTGTMIRFKADSEIFTESTVYDYETLLRRLREQAFLNAGLKINFFDRREEEVVGETLHYEGGIREFVDHIHRSKSADPIFDEIIHIQGVKDDMFAEIALQYNSGYSEFVLSFANNIHTPDGGAHEVGFKNALTKALNDYAKRFNLIKDGGRLSGEDVREGLTAIISVKLTNCEFEGQTKGRLGNPEVKPFVEKLVYEKLMDYLEENPQTAKVIFEKSLQAQRAREAAKNARDLARKRKSALESSSLPGKLADCSDRNNEYTEIYIVEGDSAGGSAKEGRNRRFQAILPLWGKMLNVEKVRIDKVYGNDKLMPVVTALGTSMGEDFDITKLRYGKVIIMADADVDGSHIRTLLLTFFFRYMRPLIEQGHVYCAQPPLYKVWRGKNVKYAFSDEERDMFTAEFEASGGKADIQRYKGLGEMNPMQLWETTLDPERRTMIKISVEDAQKADEAFTILMGEKVEPRRQFIESNAQYATNLDL
ncbi:MAG: DNA topoisomerase (ATP-hydrolyzing) subunit B [Ruminococcus sp.]|nr:DNA topoisomerase (ATP-hydrolyzing) subunit B [Ruminococcus sp.]